MIPEKSKRKPGGRPKSLLPADRKVGIRLTHIQFKLIEAYAIKSEMTISEYMRTMALKGKVELFKRSFPKEAINLISTFNHIAANINNLAHRNNRGDFLTPEDRKRLGEWLNDFIVHRNKLEGYIRDDSKSKIDQ